MSNNIDTIRDDKLKKIFNIYKPVIGVLHLHPLPGSPNYKGESIEQIVEYTLVDLDAYINGGIDGLIVENMGDNPFLRPDDIGLETISIMSVIAFEVVKQAKSRQLPVGINCLANHAIGAIAIAAASKAQFIRVNQWVNAYIADEGYIEGEAGKVLRFRNNINARSIKIFADVHVKHGSHNIVADRSIEDQARDAIFSNADVLISSGIRTGDPPKITTIEEMKSVSNTQVIAGSGVTDNTVNEILTVADGAIVGTYFKHDGILTNHVDTNRVRSLMTIVKQLRN